MHNYTISLFPKEGKREAELFGRLMSICLTPNLNPTTSSTYYLSCRRPIDKEDWYFAMKAASQQIQLVDQSLMYDTFAMTQLRGILSSTPSQVEAQCWNAIMGRMFLGIYKTDHWHQLWHTKMKNKLARVNTDGMIRLSPFQLQHISMGDTIPCLTNTTLQEFGADGHCVIHGDLTYDGTVLVVIRTDFHWPTLINKKKKANAAASLPLMLSIKLRHCSGKVVFKVKPPPSGRIWAGFQDMPMMEWEVTPVVMETHIKWSMVINMIQAKLKELVLDTLVVPNMEDFPFFDSDGLGGIFGKMDNTTAAASTQEPTATTATAPMTTIPTPKVEPATIDGTITDDTTQDNGDSAIDVDMTFDDDDDDDVQPDNKEPPRVSRLVQGYMNRIKNPHRFPSPLHSRPPSTTKV
ncbi:hypothetical protein BC941DRAFT_395116 [Chlamydoabsidia padenii]|nr:hypothetical protein BC941DRAFT_395116 [Chlamydoabsidia padenii]